jgi:hypothetical protein
MNGIRFDGFGLTSARSVHRGVAVVILALASATGCIERTVSINTEPQGATVFLNDEEVGQTPIRVPFTWYGDYDIIIRKDGFETVQTHHRIHTPWYQYPFIDIVSECFVPFTIHDDHVVDTFALQKYEAPVKDELLYRSGEMRARALLEAGGN